MAIVGTQADANDKRSVSREEGESLANKYRCLFFEASSKTGENVNEVFTKLVQKANKLRKKITSVDTKGFSSVPSSRNSVCSIYSTPDPTPSNNNTSLKLKKETSSAWAYDELFMEVVDHCKLEVSHYFENIIESSLILLSLLALSWILGNLFLFSALVIFLLYIYKEPANEGTMTLLKKFFPQQIVIVQNRFGYLLSLINLLINFSTWVVIVGLIGYFRFITFSTVFFLWCLLLGTICIAYFLCLKALRHPDPIEFKFSKPKKLEQKDFNAESCHWLNVWLQSNWIAIAQVFSAELHDQFASSLEEQLKQGTSILPKTVTDLIGIQLIGVGIDDTTCPILTSIHGSPPISGNYVLEVNTEFGGQIFVELELIASVQGNPMSLIRFRIESFSFSGIVNFFLKKRILFWFQFSENLASIEC